MTSASLKMAVLGDPVHHSQSPKIHGLFAQQANLAIEYEAIHCPQEALADQLQTLHANGYLGLNLTVPLKEHALALCNELSSAAAEAGAVNTLVRTEAGWSGTNTDGAGLVKDMAAHNLTLQDQRIVILGAGGAAAGIAGPLLAAGVSALAVMNRTLARAEALCRRFDDARMRAYPLVSDSADHANQPPFDGLIQASSQGHSGTITLPDERWLTPQAWCYDLNYGNAHPRFRDWARTDDRVVVDGLGMLVQQAALSFEHWTGFEPDPAPVIAALRRALNA